ncbi:MAG TPA: hypothetical protein VKU01_10550 [Bryobacteraceae bacterium]|nr:hypothetical protein [Bryobacteraceae bacterium]
MAKKTEGTRKMETRPTQPSDLQVYERAMALFNTGDFSGAKELFGTLKGSANLGIAHAAASRRLMCDRRLAE